MSHQSVRCRCGTVNMRENLRCSSCSEPLPPLPAAAAIVQPQPPHRARRLIALIAALAVGIVAGALVAFSTDNNNRPLAAPQAATPAGVAAGEPAAPTPQPRGPRAVALPGYGASPIDVPSDLRNVVQIIAGKGFSAALTEEGRVLIWGRQRAYARNNAVEGIRELSGGEERLYLIDRNGFTTFGGSVLSSPPQEWQDADARYVESSGPFWVGGPYGGPAVLQRDGTLRLIVNDMDSVLIQTVPGSYTDLRNNDGVITALRADGQLVTAAYGDLRPVDGLNDIVAISSHFAVRRDGTVVNQSGEAQAGIQDAVAVADSARYGLALRRDGSVVHWRTETQTLLAIPAQVQRVQAIAVSDTHALALRSDGTVVAWFPQEPVPVVPEPQQLLPVVEACAGAGHYLVRYSDGTIAGWGRNDFGQAEVPADMPTVRQIACTENYSLALTAAGQLLIWGEDAQQLQAQAAAVDSSQQGFRSVAAGGGSFAVIQLTGEVVLLYRFDENILQAEPLVTAGREIVALSVLDHHVLMRAANGEVLVGGYQAGVNQEIGFAYIQKRLPALPDLPLTAVAVAAGDEHGLALLADGSVRSWGNDLLPPAVAQRRDIVAIAAGRSVSVAVTADGQIMTWGALADQVSAVIGGELGVRQVVLGDAGLVMLQER